MDSTDKFCGSNRDEPSWCEIEPPCPSWNCGERPWMNGWINERMNEGVQDGFGSVVCVRREFVRRILIQLACPCIDINLSDDFSSKVKFFCHLLGGAPCRDTLEKPQRYCTTSKPRKNFSDTWTVSRDCRTAHYCMYCTISVQYATKVRANKNHCVLTSSQFY